MIWLPEMEVNFTARGNGLSRLFVAGGRPPRGEWLKKTAASYKLWAVDRGIDICYECGLIPEHLAGDADSACTVSWDWGKRVSGKYSLYLPEKNYTDLQLALRLAGSEAKVNTVIVTGGWGGRFDHCWSNVMSLLWAGEWGIEYCIMADEQEALVFVRGKAEVRFNLFQTVKNISLLPLSAVCEEVTIDNVCWPLEKQTLYLGRPFAVSNRLAGGKKDFSVSVSGGCLGVYLEWA